MKGEGLTGKGRKESGLQIEGLNWQGEGCMLLKDKFERRKCLGVVVKIQRLSPQRSGPRLWAQLPPLLQITHTLLSPALTLSCAPQLNIKQSAWPGDSVGWTLSGAPKGYRFDYRSGHIPRLQFNSSLGPVWEAPN